MTEIVKSVPFGSATLQHTAFSGLDLRVVQGYRHQQFKDDLAARMRHLSSVLQCRNKLTWTAQSLHRQQQQLRKQEQKHQSIKN